MCPYIQITLPSYGVLAFIGAFAALLFLYFRLDRFDIAFTQFLKLVALCAVGCVLGSKLMYALTQVPWLIENFSAKNLLMLIPNSGYVFYGGLLGVILAIYLYAKKRPRFTRPDLPHGRPCIPAVSWVWTYRLFYGRVLLWGQTCHPRRAIRYLYARQASGTTDRGGF